MWSWALWMFPLLWKFSLTALPAKPENISCMLYYGKNLTCTWNPEETNYTNYTVKRAFHSRGSIRQQFCEANSSTGALCSFKQNILPPGNFSIEVKAENAGGIITSNVTYWSLNAIVKTEPPEILSVEPVLGIKRMVQIKWEIPKPLPSPTILKYMLRYRTVDSIHWVEANFTTGLKVYNLTELQASTEYVVALRCMHKGSGFWSDWSQEKMAITEEEVPHVLDLWRVLRPAKEDGRRPVWLLWKLAQIHIKDAGAPLLWSETLTSGAITKCKSRRHCDLLEEAIPGWLYGNMMEDSEVPHPREALTGVSPPVCPQVIANISGTGVHKSKEAPVLEKTLGYNLWSVSENNTNLTAQQFKLHLRDETYWVSVTSYNSLGESQPATLRIPAVHEKPFQCIKAMQAYLAQDQLVVEWQNFCAEVDTWMVEWFPDLDSNLSAISWESVSRATNWTIQQDKLEPFQCYNISVYPMLQDHVGEPYTIQAYGKEGIPSQGPVAKAENINVKAVTITWEEIPKSERKGFISHYTIFYQAEDGKEFSETVNSSIRRHSLESLTRKTSYTLWVMASTRAGGANGTRINFKTMSLSVSEIVLVTSLVGGGLLILIILTVASGLKKPHKLTHLCWPDVPNPAESSIATWRGDDFKGKLNLKEFDDSMNTEDRILKPCSVPRDLIDKLVVNFENFLEEVSTEEARKGKESILGGEENEYVTSPYRPACPPGKSFEESLVLTEIPVRKSQHLYLEIAEETCSEATEQYLSPGQNVGPDHLHEEVAPNPYLKNSVTTREFLVPENLPEHVKRAV